VYDVSSGRDMYASKSDVRLRGRTQRMSVTGLAVDVACHACDEACARARGRRRATRALSTAATPRAPF
jgi:hypothetical protein